MKDFVTKANVSGGDDSGTATFQGAKEQNSVNNELKNFVVSAGQTPTSGTGDDPDTEMLARGITIAAQTSSGYQDSGAANAYVLTRTGLLKQPGSYVNSSLIAFKTSNPNTGATTVNNSGLGVKKILTPSGAELSAGDIVSTDYNVIIYNSAADSGSGAYELYNISRQDNILIVVDQKSQNVAGGTFTSGARRTRDINTVLRNTIPGSSLAANRITLPAGDYIIKASCPAYAVGSHQASLQNITAASTLTIGTSEQASLAGDATTRSILNDEFSLGVTSDIEIQHECVTTQATNGFGLDANLNVEKYTEVTIWKL